MTPHDTTDRTGPHDRPEIEITEEMIEAGWDELASSEGDILFPSLECRGEVLRRVFLAMLNAARRTSAAQS